DMVTSGEFTFDGVVDFLIRWEPSEGSNRAEGSVLSTHSGCDWGFVDIFDLEIDELIGEPSVVDGVIHGVGWGSEDDRDPSAVTLSFDQHNTVFWSDRDEPRVVQAPAATTAAPAARTAVPQATTAAPAATTAAPAATTAAPTRWAIEVYCQVEKVWDSGHFYWHWAEVKTTVWSDGTSNKLDLGGPIYGGVEGFRDLARSYTGAPCHRVTLR
ncbi:uncharacterized protein METZ01_LOCUS361412, partial [marine metagenome]